MDCEICYEEFQTDGLKAPKILHACGHTFCGKCLKKLTVDKVINCPLDRIDTSLADQSLNKNYYIISKIEEASTSGQACQLHPSQHAILYCKEASCQGKTLMICSVCITKGPHKGHAHSSIDEERRQRKLELEKLEKLNLELVTNMEKIVKLNEFALDSCTNDVLGNQRKANAEYFKKAKSDVMTWCRNYIKNMDSIESALKLSLLEQEERAESEKARTNDDRKKLKIMKKHTEHFESIKRSDLCKIPKADICVDLKYGSSKVRLLPTELMIPNMPKLPSLPELVQITPTRHFHFEEDWWESRKESQKFVTDWIPKNARIVVKNDEYVGFEYKNAKAVIWKKRFPFFSDSTKCRQRKVFFVDDLSESTIENLEITMEIDDLPDAMVVWNNNNWQDCVTEVCLPNSNIQMKCCGYNNFENLIEQLLDL